MLSMNAYVCGRVQANMILRDRRLMKKQHLKLLLGTVIMLMITIICRSMQQREMDITLCLCILSTQKGYQINS